MGHLEKVEEALSGASNRRGFIGAIFRGLIGIAVTTAARCSGLPSFALQTDCHFDGLQNSGENDVSFDTGTGGAKNYCIGNPSSWECAMSSNGIRDCDANDGCSGKIDAISNSKCGGDMTSFGYWDCCCDGKSIRYRDCVSDGVIICMCRAWIGNCGN